VTPSQKGRMIRGLLEALSAAVERPATQQRLKLEDAITRVATELDAHDKRYLAGRLDGLGADIVTRQDGLSPRDLFIESTRDMWRHGGK
jgi:hypothetical protein